MFSCIKALFQKEQEVEIPEYNFRMEATRIEHPENSKVYYLELRDNLRLIFEDDKCVGFYIA